MTIIPTRGAPEFARLGDVGLILVVLLFLVLVLIIGLAVFVFVRHSVGPSERCPSARSAAVGLSRIVGFGKGVLVSSG